MNSSRAHLYAENVLKIKTNKWGVEALKATMHGGGDHARQKAQKQPHDEMDAFIDDYGRDVADEIERYVTKQLHGKQVPLATPAAKREVAQSRSFSHDSPKI